VSAERRGATPRGGKKTGALRGADSARRVAGAATSKPARSGLVGATTRGARARITVIGGAGAMGRITVRDLVETAPAGIEIVLADRAAEAAQVVVRALPAKARRRVRIVEVDATDVAGTARALAGTTVLINACHHTFNLRVMAVALACGSHYCDLGGLFHVTRQQLRLHRKFERAGLLALCGIGSAPGIVNVMAHAAAEGLDTVSEIHIAVGTADLRAQRAAARAATDGRARGATRAAAADAEAKPVGRRVASASVSESTEPGVTPAVPALATSYSLDTILDEASCPAALFTGGELRFVEALSGESAVDFPKPVGRQYPARTLHSELATLPESFADRGVREVSFRIAFTGDLMERLRFLHRLGLTGHEPIRVGGVRVAPRDLLLALVARQSAAAAAQSAAASAARSAGASARAAAASAAPVRASQSRSIASAADAAHAASEAPDEYEVLRVTVRGHVRDGGAVEVVSDCHVPGIPAWGLGVDVDTGCPPSIVAQMLVRGDIDARGVLPPERAVPAAPFFRELKARGLRITRRTRPS
jgi:saccharopine dehydrogenase (NAD+, L-lysine-forming)